MEKTPSSFSTTYVLIRSIRNSQVIIWLTAKTCQNRSRCFNFLNWSIIYSDKLASCCLGRFFNLVKAIKLIEEDVDLIYQFLKDEFELNLYVSCCLLTCCCCYWYILFYVVSNFLCRSVVLMELDGILSYSFVINYSALIIVWRLRIKIYMDLMSYGIPNGMNISMIHS